MRVTILGAGDAFCSGGRRQSSYFVEAAGGGFLLDCGTTTLLALKTLGIAVERIDFVAISHLHGDHFGGLPFIFLEAIYERPRNRPLLIVGPPGTEERVRTLHQAMYRELAERGTPFPLQFRECTPDQALTVQGVELLPFRVPHQERDVSLGYRIAAGGKTLLYSGDCGWNEALAHHSHGSDLFICECCYFDSQTSFHISYPQIARQRDRIGCKRLLLSHLGREVLERLDEIQLECAYDGLVVEV
jgi:ribonuclease BN (tRNA processing enzyme)